MKKRILVSACLLGIPCRYDGRSVRNEEALRLLEGYELVPFCPEVYGGLPTPRTPSELVSDRVFMKDGTDVTDNFHRGALAAYELCELMDIRTALLKERSPSCGKGRIYDGSFTSTLTDGDGVTARYLAERGIRVIGESEITLLL